MPRLGPEVVKIDREAAIARYRALRKQRRGHWASRDIALGELISWFDVARRELSKELQGGAR